MAPQTPAASSSADADVLTRTQKKNMSKIKKKLDHSREWLPEEEHKQQRTEKQRELKIKLSATAEYNAETNHVLVCNVGLEHPPLHKKEVRQIQAFFDFANSRPDELEGRKNCGKAIGTVEERFQPPNWAACQEICTKLLECDMVVFKDMDLDTCNAAWQWGFVDYRSFDMRFAIVRFWYFSIKILLAARKAVGPLHVAFFAAVNEELSFSNDFTKRHQFVYIWRTLPAEDDIFRLTKTQMKLGNDAIRQYHKHNADEWAKEDAEDELSGHFSLANFENSEVFHRMLAKRIADQYHREGLKLTHLHQMLARGDDGNHVVMHGVEGMDDIEMDADHFRKIERDASILKHSVDPNTRYIHCFKPEKVYAWVPKVKESAVAEDAEEGGMDMQKFKEYIAQLKISE